MKALLVDFDDSFVFNIMSEFEDLEVETSIINYRNFYITELDEFDFIILGPGPGHPTDYYDFISTLSKISKKTIGICLGHQLLMSSLGYDIKSINPIHGQNKKISIPIDFPLKTLRNKTLDVQYYNSLVVDSDSRCSSFYLDYNIYINSDIFSMQFHPESIGTSCPLLIFESILEWVYNYGDE